MLFSEALGSGPSALPYLLFSKGTRLLIMSSRIRTLVMCLGTIATFAVGTCAAGEVDNDARAKQIRDDFKVIEADYAKFRKDMDNIVRVKFDANAGLLLNGEEIVLTVDALSDKKPNPVLEVQANCYDPQPAVQTFNLDWKKNSSGTGYSAVWKWKPPTCGNYLLHWTCDIGGDIPEFWRNFSVIDSRYAVMVLNSTSHASPPPQPDFHELHLPFNYWWEPHLRNGHGDAGSFVDTSKLARQYGDDPGCLIFTSTQYAPGDAVVFRDEPEEVQKLVMTNCERLAQMCGFPHPVKSLLTYGFGNGPMRIAREVGFDMIGALCPDQNWQDGSFKINHWGMPARPFFMSDEDFRKPGLGGPNAIVGIPQCERQTMECRDYNCIFSVEGGMTYWLDRDSSCISWTQKRSVNDNLCAREDDFIRCFTESAGQTHAPLFFTGCFEFNGVWPERAAANRNYMEYLVKVARSTHIAYTTASSVVDFYHKHYKWTPESVLYLVDIYAGHTSKGKPALYPDTMELENGTFKTIFLKGQVLPHVYVRLRHEVGLSGLGQRRHSEEGHGLRNSQHAGPLSRKALPTGYQALRRQEDLE